MSMCSKSLQFRHQALVSAALPALLLGASTASAQSQGTLVATGREIDSNSVNLVSGAIDLPAFTAGVGSAGNGGMTFVHNGSATNISYGLTIAYGTLSCSAYLNLGFIKKEFYCVYGSPNIYTSRIPDGSKLEVASGKHIFTDSDGTKIEFPPYQYQYQGAAQFTDQFVPSKLVKPNGETWNFKYEQVITTQYYPYNNQYVTYIEKQRLVSIVNNFGYQLHFDYISANSADTYWSELAGVAAINNKVEYCDPAAVSCNVGASWPKFQMSRTTQWNPPVAPAIYGIGVEEKVLVDSAGIATKIKTTWDNNQFGNGYPEVTEIDRGMDGIPEISYKFKYYAVQNPSGYTGDMQSPPLQIEAVSQVVKGGQTWNYNWGANYSMINEEAPAYFNTGPTIRLTDFTTNHVTRTDPTSATLVVDARVETGKVFGLVDEISRASADEYDIKRRRVKSTSPDGQQTLFAYDGQNNIISTTRVAKPGSGLANIVTSAGYEANCSNPVTCHKPLWVRDALGNQTDFTYSPIHGGLLTEMKSAPSPGAARPLVISNWVQKYAWIKNSAGALVQSADPVWLLSDVTECQTAPGSSSASCDASAPIKITVREYGSPGTRESTLIKGIAVSAGGVTSRTCFTYDSQDRKISQTSANANLTSCP